MRDKLISEYEIIFVDDGSQDKSFEEIKRITTSDHRVKFVRLTRNHGYGRALKEGFAAASMQYVFFSDTDCQFNIDEIRVLTPLLEKSDYVIGYRIKRN